MRQINNPVDIRHAQAFDIVQLFNNTFQIANTIAVRIFEAAGINLINDDFFPPFGVGDGCLKFRLGSATKHDGNNQKEEDFLHKICVNGGVNLFAFIWTGGSARSQKFRNDLFLYSTSTSSSLATCPSCRVKSNE